MWLLDNNLPLKVALLLESFSVRCDTAKNRNWTRLKNGMLVAAASEAGFTCILTRDKLFQESAAQVLKKYPSMAIVLLVLPQGRSRLYLESFKVAWQLKAIAPVPGQVVLWP